MRLRLVALALSILLPVGAGAQQVDRDAKVRSDRDTFRDSDAWIYNDLDKGIVAAREAGKPLLVVFRCIPCEACQEFDDDVARRDPIIRDLLDEFVCVRIVQANAIDLTTFQFDFDQSFAIVMMLPDRTVLGRFGTRSDRMEAEDISLEGLRAALKGALALAGNIEAVRPSLAGKQVDQARFKTPLDFPSLSERYGSAINYEGQVARSCIHCHQVRDAERQVFRDEGRAIPDEVLYPYPDPEVLGLTMDPKAMARVEAVEPDSPAAKAGLAPGDEIRSLDGQPLLSIADLQWVLHRTKSAAARLPAEVARDGSDRTVAIDLPDDWRRGNISWRVTSYNLRRMALGGMIVRDLADDDRKALGLSTDAMALRVIRVGQFGAHAVAKNAGFLADDVIVGFDGQDDRKTESDLLAYALQRKRAGDQVEVAVLRGGERRTLPLPLQ